jgi:hypothetical protein
VGVEGLAESLGDYAFREGQHRQNSIIQLQIGVQRGTLLASWNESATRTEGFLLFPENEIILAPAGPSGGEIFRK